MDILMIGHSGSGKTTYMAGLYSQMKSGVVGFTIDSNFSEYYRNNTTDCSYSSFIKQEQDLDKIALDLHKGLYPPPTMIRQEYYFNLVCKGHSIPFNWYDYRGGVLMEKTASSSDAEELVRKIQYADALVVFIDGDTLMENLNSTVRQYRRLITYINNAIANIRRDENEYFPISFVITKGDIHDWDEMINSDGFKYFAENLFTPIRNSKSVVGMMTITEINHQNIFNVHFPLLFSILHGMPNYVRTQIRNYEREMEELDFFENIGEFFTDSRKKQFLKTCEAISQNWDILNETIIDAKKKSIIFTF